MENIEPSLVEVLSDTPFDVCEKHLRLLLSLTDHFRDDVIALVEQEL